MNIPLLAVACAWTLTMTRKDYVLIADAMRHSRIFLDSTDDNGDSLTQWLSTVEKVAEYLRGENIRFDSSKFYGACGVS